MKLMVKGDDVCYGLLYLQIKMLSTKSFLILRLNRNIFYCQLSRISNETFGKNSDKSIGYQNLNQRQSLTPIMIGLRHNSEDTKNKPKEKPILNLKYVDDRPRLTSTERMKRLIQNYGMTAMALHISLSLTSLGIWYSIIYFGIDVPHYIDFERFGAVGNKVLASSGTFAVAYAIHKLTVPARITLTVFLTPVLVNWLRKKGLIKKPHKYL
jgi:hypothetical protein